MTLQEEFDIVLAWWLITSVAVVVITLVAVARRLKK